MLTISLKYPQEYNVILRIFTLSSTRECFQYVLCEKHNIFRYNLCNNYAAAGTRLALRWVAWRFTTSHDLLHGEQSRSLRVQFSSLPPPAEMGNCADKIYSRMLQTAALNFFSRGSMLALAFSPHKGFEVKESNTLLVFSQSKFVWDLVRSIINFSKWRI